MLDSQEMMSFMLPVHYWQQEGELLGHELLKDAELALLQWAVYWDENRDRGFGLGFPKMTTFERMLHPSTSGRNLCDLPPMQPVVKAVDLAVQKMPFEYRVLAWVWWVELGASQQQTTIRYCRAKGVRIANRVQLNTMLHSIRFFISAELME